MKIKFILPILTLACLLAACYKWDNPYDPNADLSLLKVTTNPVSNITANSVQCNGTVEGIKALDRGFCWGTTPNPTISGLYTSDGSGMGIFSSQITGLQIGTAYYVRAYAVVAAGTVYGNEVIFIFDIDNNYYNIVTIGTQVWMKENLKTTKYCDGTAITNITDETAWVTQTAEAYCWYNNDIANKATYGALYNFYTVVDNRNLCPTGWHVPTDTEWSTLTTYLGGESLAGGKLKAITLWVSPNTGADNSSGFTALPGGYRNYYSGRYDYIGGTGYWWSSTRLNVASAWGRALYCSNSEVGRYSNDKSYGFSVRCLKDL